MAYVAYFLLQTDFVSTKENDDIITGFSSFTSPQKCSVFCTMCSCVSDMTKDQGIRTGAKQYKCSFCDQRFNIKGNLKMYQRIHTGKKPYKCSFCDKMFTQLDSLKRHQCIHTGQNRHQFYVSDKRFSQLHHLCTSTNSHWQKAIKCSMKTKKQKSSALFI